MKLKDFLRNIKFEKPDRDTVIRSVDKGLLMFIGVPFLYLLYYGGKVATVAFVGVRLIFWSVYLYRLNVRWELKHAMGLRGERRERVLTSLSEIVIV